MDELNDRVRALIGELMIEKLALELRVRALERELQSLRPNAPGDSAGHQPTGG